LNRGLRRGGHVLGGAVDRDAQDRANSIDKVERLQRRHFFSDRTLVIALGVFPGIR
jgi:hypothetical protein